MRHLATYEYGIRLRRLKNNFITEGTWRINETGTVQYIRSFRKKKLKRKKTHVIQKQIGNKYVSCFSIRVLRGRVKVYSMLLFFNLRVWADNIYRGIIRSRPICLPQNDCLIYIFHQRRTAVCATQKTVLKSELMTTRYVESSPPLSKRQKEGVLKFSRASPA